jgi:hypothetical protein
MAQNLFVVLLLFLGWVEMLLVVLVLLVSTVVETAHR